MVGSLPASMIVGSSPGCDSAGCAGAAGAAGAGAGGAGAACAAGAGGGGGAGQADGLGRLLGRTGRLGAAALGLLGLALGLGQALQLDVQLLLQLGEPVLYLRDVGPHRHQAGLAVLVLLLGRVRGGLLGGGSPTGQCDLLLGLVGALGRLDLDLGQLLRGRCGRGGELPLGFRVRRGHPLLGFGGGRRQPLLGLRGGRGEPLLGLGAALRRVALGLGARGGDLLVGLDAPGGGLLRRGGAGALRLGLGVAEQLTRLGTQALRLLGQLGAVLLLGFALLGATGGQGQVEVAGRGGGALTGVGEQPLGLGALVGDLLCGTVAQVVGLVLGQRQDLLDPRAQVPEGDPRRHGAAGGVGELQLELLHLPGERLKLRDGLVPLGGQGRQFGLDLDDVSVHLLLVEALEGRIEAGFR
jgi:hypothetical protein